MEIAKPQIMFLTKIVVAILLICGILIGIIVPALSYRQNGTEFLLKCQTESVAGSVPVFKYESQRTGLHLTIAQVEGPVVQGFLTVVTEAHDDDGLPHTLEHLVFLGSEDYPYKGILDLLANRCLARGTNAWTAVDHTAYTVKTAGKDGLLNLLPIYLDHLLYPTLMDSAFTTEIYHVTGDGQDAGVVYSEMQARENSGAERTYTALKHALYPEPSGYRYETGGILANIRNNLTHDKIREYHKVMYRPENLHVILIGQVDPQEVFSVLRSIEEKIVSRGERPPFVRPWQSPVPPFEESVEQEVVYSSDTEDTGIIRVGWRGPSLVEDVSEYQSLVVLMKYLTDTSVSPLPKVFVDIEDPLASYVHAYTKQLSISSALIAFSGVPKDKIDEVKPLLTRTLNKIASNVIPFNIEVLRNTLHNLIQKEESNLESSPHSVFSGRFIQDILYGQNCEYLDKVLNRKSWYEHLLTQPTSYWLKLLKKYLISSPSVTVKGIPSIAEAARYQDEEKKRVEKRKEMLGEEGLKEWGQKLEQAKKTNEIPPPEAMLESLPVPSTESINFHHLKAYTNINNHESGSIPMSDASVFDLSAVPIKMQLDDINSNFVQIVAVLDTHSLSPSERLYIPLLMELLLESPIMKGDQTIPYDEVVKTISADTMTAHSILGLSLYSQTFTFGSYINNVGLNFKTEMAKYEKGVEWMSDILFRVIFDAERVSVKANKLLNSIGERKRSGTAVFKLMFIDLVYKKDTNINKVNPFRQEKFLKEVIETLKSDPDKILRNLNNIYRNITDLDNITIHLASNFGKLSSTRNVTAPWLSLAKDGNTSSTMEMNVVADWMQRLSFPTNQSVTGYITGMGSVESSFMFQTTHSITNHLHEDLPALLTAITYLTQMEGPMWKQIRGKGLSYSYELGVSPTQGMLTLELYKAAQVVGAYKEARRMINSYLDGSEPWDRLLFDSARSSLIYEVINRESEISDVVQQSLLAYYKKVPLDYNRSFVNAINEVKLEDMDRVAQKYFRPMIDPQLSRTVVVCQTYKVQEIKDELNKLGHNIEVISSLENSRFAEL